MSALKLRRFTDLAVLKTIAPRRLTQLLSQFTAYLSQNGLELGSALDAEIPYQRLIDILMSPSERMPEGLIDSLYQIDQMSNEDCMHELLDEVEGLAAEIGEDPTPADVAVAAWFIDPSLFSKKIAEAKLTSMRGLEYFAGSPQVFDGDVSGALFQVLEADLDRWFVEKKRGPGCRVFRYPTTETIGFLVRHGAPFRREGALVDGESASVYFRPEQYDVLILDRSTCQLRTKVGAKARLKLYLEMFGRHLMGNGEFFKAAKKFTLKPLTEDGEKSLFCTDVEGLEWIKLTEIQVFWPGRFHEIEIRKSDDIFQAYAARGRRLPSLVRLTSAKFKIKFADAKAPRALEIRPINKSAVHRDDDARLVEEWMRRRGFLLS